MRHHRTKTGETILAYVVLAILSFLCLFFFYILIVNSPAPTRTCRKASPGCRETTSWKI